MDKDEAVKYGLIEDLHTMFTTSPGSCGNFGCEFYAAKESQAWMSCGYGEDGALSHARAVCCLCRFGSHCIFV